ANEYEVEASTSLNFGDSVSSGWFHGTNYTFHELQGGRTYHYRVHCRTNLSAWGQTLASEFAANENVNVSVLTSPGDIVLSGNTNRLWHEDFEEPTAAWTNTLFTAIIPSRDSVTFEKQPLTAATRAADAVPPLPINPNGDQEGRVHSSGSTHWFAFATNDSPGQLVDTTVDAYLALMTEGPAVFVDGGVLLRGDPGPHVDHDEAVAFVAAVGMYQSPPRYLQIYLLYGGYLQNLTLFTDGQFETETLDENYHLRFSVRGAWIIAELWRVTARDGVLHETPVKLGNGTNVLSVYGATAKPGYVGLSGIALGQANVLANSTFFDDITIQSHEYPPHYAAFGSSTVLIAAPGLERWGELQFMGNIPTPDTKLTIDVLDQAGTLLASNIVTGTDLGGIAAIAGNKALRLRANFATSDPAQTPALSEWSLDFRLAAENPSESDWSNIASSTQDIDRPSVTITEPAEGVLVTSNNVVKVSGLAEDTGSGISRVTVNAVAATTANGFTNWTAIVPLYNTTGTNLLIAIAYDNAIPPNAATALIRLVRKPSTSLASTQENGPTVIKGQELYDETGVWVTDHLMPRLNIGFDAGAAIISWFPVLPDYVLQTATTLSPANWEDASATVSPVRIDVTAQQRYFRLIRK
ncbi:MAG TPA: hypothetical protein VK615_07915, partial [Candidatus Binatia bacterium]|nr:hypothetical protein [Candidatus Binatia bacterium]